MSDDEKPTGSLADQAANWVPPWARPKPEPQPQSFPELRWQSDAPEPADATETPDAPDLPDAPAPAADAVVASDGADLPDDVEAPAASDESDSPDVLDAVADASGDAELPDDIEAPAASDDVALSDAVETPAASDDVALSDAVETPAASDDVALSDAGEVPAVVDESEISDAAAASAATGESVVEPEAVSGSEAELEPETEFEPESESEFEPELAAESAVVDEPEAVLESESEFDSAEPASFEAVSSSAEPFSSDATLVGDVAEGVDAVDAVEGGSGVQEALPGVGADTAGEGDAAPEAARAEMTDSELRGAVEAILLVVDEPTSETTLAQVLEQPVERVLAALEAASLQYTSMGFGFDLRRVAGGWRLYTRPQYAGYVEKFVLDGQQIRLTQAALETLAVVAYKQPVTRSRISAIRGVNCDGVVRTLVTRGLIEETGSEPESGAFLYRTTTLFLEKLGLDSVDQLPPLAPFLPDDIDEIADAQR